MKVKKRDGSYENVSFDKVFRRLELLSEDLSIDSAEIAKMICSQITDGISTSELDELAAELSYSRLTVNLDFEVLAKRIIISNNQKNTSNLFSDVMYQLYSKNIINTPLYKFIDENKIILNAAIINDRDYDLSYFGFKTLDRSYLLKIDGKTVERFQYLIMRVCCAIHYPNIPEIVSSYNYASKKYFSFATPTLYNGGTNREQFLSCFLSAPSDDLAGIYKWITNLALISKDAGGIGGSVSGIRSAGSIIKGTQSHSSGLVPMLGVVNSTMRYVNQGGRRDGSAAIYLEPHHADILDFLDLKKNTGSADMRTRYLFLGMWISDLFMERVQNKQKWSLFSPDTAPGLDLCYGDEYKQLYERYEREGRAITTVPAETIMLQITSSQIETGVPYILFKDAANVKSNQKNVGVIRGSNLCAEILEYHDDKEYACCCLSSLCVPQFIKSNYMEYVGKDVATYLCQETDINYFNRVYDFSLLEKVTAQCVRNLNNIIDRNRYPIEETKVSNMRHRPLAIGIQGLADVFYMLKIPFEHNGVVSESADVLNKLIFETIYWASLVESMEQAKLHGPYETFKGSPLSQGIFQFDMWNIKPTDRYDWKWLREQIMEHGVRNSLLTGCMPTASTAQIMGNCELFEPFTSNLYSRSVKAGEFVIVNKYLVEDLKKINKWT